jgi:hypothetical protein
MSITLYGDNLVGTHFGLRILVYFGIFAGLSYFAVDIVHFEPVGIECFAAAVDIEHFDNYIVAGSALVEVDIAYNVVPVEADIADIVDIAEVDNLECTVGSSA